MPTVVTTYPADLDLEELKASFRQAILDRSQVVPRTRKVHLAQVTVDTPNNLIQEMNGEGFTEHEWIATQPMPYDRIADRTYDIYGTVPTVAARLDFQVQALHPGMSYVIEVTMYEKLRLQSVVLNHLFPDNAQPMLSKPAQQFHYDADGNIVHASVITQLRDTGERNKTYGHLYDAMYPEGFLQERNHTINSNTHEIVD